MSAAPATMGEPPRPARARLLVVEDDAGVARSLVHGLRDGGFEVELTGDGARAKDALSRSGFDLVVLDLMLPGLSGLDLLESLAERPHPPIVVLTARVDLDDRLRCFALGAVDFVPKPFFLEELLARHPKLRVQVMHAGYPMIDNMLTLLQANSHVYVDVAGLIWSYPIKEVNRYIERLVDAGFEDRVMFGTDQLIWPKLMAYSIGIVQNADYLTTQQKRDILYNNAARFLRLDTKRPN